MEEVKEEKKQEKVEKHENDKVEKRHKKSKLVKKIIHNEEDIKKIKELDKIIVNARGEISNEKDQAKILLLEDKYMKEFNNKKNILEKEYSNRLSAIEKNIKNEITKKAQKDGYEYVFAKSVVLHGGKDITSELIGTIK